MTGFVDTMRLKGQGEEDTWFARHDRELVDALHQRPKGPTLALSIVSGGQTGVDRAALDAALALGLALGGWCPLGRRAEDGPIPRAYLLQETPTQDYAQRTEWNVRDSDATLILFRGRLTGGSARTAEHAARFERPLLTLDLDLTPLTFFTCHFVLPVLKDRTERARGPPVAVLAKRNSTIEVWHSGGKCG